MKKTLFILFYFTSLGIFSQSTFQSSLTCDQRNGYTVYGIVESDGKPLSGVIVSDGYEITKTDKQGRYYLASQKRNGYVFVTSPGNYTYEVKNALPSLWANLHKDKQTAERHDFQLIKANHKKFAFIGLSDFHMGNYYNAHQYLVDKFVPVVNNTIQELHKKYGNNYKVYTINGGDSSYDTYWVTTSYTIRDFPTTLKDIKYPTPMFNVMGNHDNDPFELEGPDVDFRAEQAYRDALGPTYYSFNIGKVHFVILDNIIYNNKPGKTYAKMGLPGIKDFTVGITPSQMEWLRKDLALQSHKAPLVVCLHDPIFLRKKQSLTEHRHNFTDPANVEELIKLISTFSETHIIDGHSHCNSTYYCDSLHIIDHNVSSVCGNWWRTGFSGYDTFTLGRTPKGEKVLRKAHDQINPDGTLTGYYVFYVNGKKITWDYQSISEPKNVQLRAWDMNEVRQYCRNNSDYEHFIKVYSKRCDYRKIPDNQVWINVWAFDSKWKIKAWENGKEVPVKFEPLENPEYTFWYNFYMSVANGRFDNPSYNKVKHGITFLVECSSPTSTLDIEVTDSFGKKYHQTMIRPKKFDPNL